jgi:Fis family transcriptional regulator
MDIQTAIKHSLTQYFVNLDGADAHNIYALMLAQVERPMLEIIMQQANNNQSKAAQWLGLSRNTLRKLLAKYNLG